MTRQISGCRICRSDNLVNVLDLGHQPLANEFVTSPRNQDTYPLFVLRCVDCGLVQLSVVVDPKLMFQNYLYASSASAPIVAHFEEYAAEVARRFAPQGSTVIEIGSNDGVLLEPLDRRDIGVFGFEPATNLAKVANDRGLTTSNTFFSEQAVRDSLCVSSANVVIANNVMAHVDDLHDFMRGVDAALRPDGVFIAEFPYLGDLLAHTEYDTIYHEHLSYFSLAPLERLFARYGMRVFDIKHLPQQGGSIRVYVCRGDTHKETDAAWTFREDEDERGFAYGDFADRVVASRRALVGMLNRLFIEGHSVSAFGASAKGNTLLNYCEIVPDLIQLIYDDAPLKQGLYTPGTHIPVVAPSTLDRAKPEYIVLLAWNYADAIAKRYPEYVGRFIHPIPLARLV